MSVTKVTDLHSHILPYVDDGSDDLQMSIEMLRMEKQQGIDCVVATPHFYAHRDNPERFLSRRREGELLLREAMEQYDDLPELKIGAEVRYFASMSQSEILPELSIDHKKYILVEMPFAKWTDAMYRELCEIYERQDLIPVVAHVERYINRFTMHRVLEKLADTPALIQANAEFFLDKRTSGIALKMLKNGQIHLLGSDCHNLSSRKPNLGDALKMIHDRLGEETLLRIADHAAWLF